MKINQPDSDSQVARNVFLGEKQRPTVRCLSTEPTSTAFASFSSSDNIVTLKRQMITKLSTNHRSLAIFINDVIMNQLRQYICCQQITNGGWFSFHTMLIAHSKPGP